MEELKDVLPKAICGINNPFAGMTEKERIDYEQFVLQEEKRKQIEQQKILESKRLEKYQSEESGVNRKFWNSSIKDFHADSENEKNILKVVSDFIADVKNKNCNKFLLMFGTFGTGKTLLGSSIIRECGGYYTTSFKMCIEYESSSDFRAKKSKLEVYDFYCNVPVLVIDEFGASDKKATEKELIANIIDQRYENNLPTVLISNLTKQQIVEILGRRIFDRLTEICTSVEFTGESRRKELRSVEK